MKIIELTFDEMNIEGGVQAISVVEQPAIESNFIALSKEHEVKFAEVQGEKRILMGAAMIPNKTIYRKNGEDEFYVYFSQATIRKASEIFFKSQNQKKSTLEHELKLDGMTVVESWIVDDVEKDKSAAYNLSVPVGTWMVSVKVDNEEVWNDYVKTGKVKGFSIEGYFADRAEMASHIDEEEESAKAQIEKIKDLLK